MKSIKASYLEISCLKGLQFLNPGDPKWPLTSIKHTRIHLCIITHPNTKHETHLSFLPWNNLFEKFSVFDHRWPQVTPDDLWPPPKSHDSSSCHTHSPIKYEIYASFLPWDIVSKTFSEFDSSVTSSYLWPPPKTGIIFYTFSHLHTK